MGYDPNEPRDANGMWSKGSGAEPYTVAKGIVRAKRELSSSEVQSIKEYMVGGAYHELNERLRMGQEPTGALKVVQEHLDAAIASHSMAKESLLYRGFDTNMDNELARIDRQGGSLKDHAFTSTSTKNDVSLIADSVNIAKIHAPAGKPALAFHGDGYTEVILPRNKTLAYMHKNLNLDGGSDYHFRYK